MKKKKSLFSYLIRFTFVFIYVCLLGFIILTGDNKQSIVASNLNQVKSIRTSLFTKKKEEKYLRVNSTYQISTYGKKQKVEFIGTLTGYGPDCVGCTGPVACSPYQNVKNGNIYYEDKDYGKIRIVASDPSVPCGSIIKIYNFPFIEGESFYAITLDRGGDIHGLTMDLLYEKEADTVKIGRQYKILFQIERWGWND